MPEQDLPPGLTDRYYNTPASRPAVVPPIASSTPTPTPTPTPAQFRDTSTSFEERMARNQVPTSTPFLDRAAALKTRADEGIKNLIGEAPTPTPTPVNTNVLTPRTVVLEMHVLPILLPSPA